MFNVMEANISGAKALRGNRQGEIPGDCRGYRTWHVRREASKNLRGLVGFLTDVPVRVCLYNNKEGRRTTDGESDTSILLSGRESRLRGEGVCSGTQHAQETVRRERG